MKGGRGPQRMELDVSISTATPTQGQEETSCAANSRETESGRRAQHVSTS